jgi:hypothetical protein
LRMQGKRPNGSIPRLVPRSKGPTAYGQSSILSGVLNMSGYQMHNYMIQRQPAISCTL